MTTRCEIFDPTENRVKDIAQLPELSPLTLVLERLSLWAQQYNLDMPAIDSGSEEFNRRLQKTLSNPRTNETSKLANDYRMKVMDFKSVNKKLIEQAKQSFTTKAEIQANAAESSKLIELQNAYDSIVWYELQIPVKISQIYIALAQYQTEPSASIHDSFNGNAKLTLICLEKSIRAWYELQISLPELSTTCFRFIYLLAKIRAYVQSDFPDAMSFIRPGFDQRDFSKVHS